MYVCMYVCMYVGMDGRMDGWMDGWMDGCTYGGMDVCVHVYMYVCAYILSLPYTRKRSKHTKETITRPSAGPSWMASGSTTLAASVGMP